MKSRMLLLSVAIALAGCGGTPPAVKLQRLAPGTRVLHFLEGITDPESRAPREVRDAVLAHLKQEVAARGLLTEDRAEATRIVQLTVTFYRMRAGASHSVLDFLAGKDGMSTMVCVRETATGGVVGVSEVACYSVLAAGSEQDIARTQGGEIAKYLLGGPE